MAVATKGLDRRDGSKTMRHGYSGEDGMMRIPL